MSGIQPYDRGQIILEKMHPFMKECFSHSCNVLQQKLEKSGYQDWEMLQFILKDVLFYAKCLQEQHKKGKIQYIIFSYLQGASLKETIEIKIDLFDEFFYLDMEECTGYFTPGIMQAQYMLDIEKLHREAEKNFIRLQMWELRELEIKYATYYKHICGRMLESMSDLIMETLLAGEIALTEDIKLLYGEYMDKTVDITRI